MASPPFSTPRLPASSVIAGKKGKWTKCMRNAHLLLLLLKGVRKQGDPVREPNERERKKSAVVINFFFICLVMPEKYSAGHPVMTSTGNRSIWSDMSL